MPRCGTRSARLRTHVPFSETHLTLDRTHLPHERTRVPRVGTDRTQGRLSSVCAGNNLQRAGSVLHRGKLLFLSPKSVSWQCPDVLGRAESVLKLLHRVRKRGRADLFRAGTDAVQHREKIPPESERIRRRRLERGQSSPTATVVAVE
jgi:hypothetical protein